MTEQRYRDPTEALVVALREVERLRAENATLRDELEIAEADLAAATAVLGGQSAKDAAEHERRRSRWAVDALGGVGRMEPRPVATVPEEEQVDEPDEEPELVPYGSEDELNELMEQEA